MLLIQYLYQSCGKPFNELVLTGDFTNRNVIRCALRAHQNLFTNSL